MSQSRREYIIASKSKKVLVELRVMQKHTIGYFDTPPTEAFVTLNLRHAQNIAKLLMCDVYELQSISSGPFQKTGGAA